MQLAIVWPRVRGPIGFVAPVAVLAVLPLTLTNFYLFIASLVLVYTIATLGFEVLVSLSGQVSFAHPVFFAAGAYGTAIGQVHGLNPWLALCLGAVCAIAIAVVSGLVALRLDEFYLALVTLGLVVVGQEFLSDAVSLTGGANGMRAPAMTLFSLNQGTDVDRYATVAIFFLLAAWLFRNINRSYLGRALNGIRDAPSGTATSGVHLYRFKVIAYVVSAILACLAGALYGSLIAFVSPDQFGFSLILLFLAISVVGGRSSVVGAVIGALAFTYVPQVLQATRASQDLVFGTAIMVTMLLAPGGLWSLRHPARRAALTVLRRGRKRMDPGHSDSTGVELRSELGAPAATTPSLGESNGSTTPGQRTAAQENSFLRVDRVSKHFGGLPALSDVSLEIRPGQILGLIGPNGSGKTTLLNCISRLYRVDSGRILYEGADITGQRADVVANNGLRRTFQKPQLIPERTVIENVMLGAHGLAYISPFALLAGDVLSSRRERLARDQAVEALQVLGIAQHSHLRVGAIAGPTQKLVEVARCLAGRPRLLLLDEVASGLNSYEKEFLAERIRTLRGRLGMAFILVEHDLDFVTGLVDSLIVLDVGRVIADGVPKDVLAAKPVMEAYIGV